MDKFRTRSHAPPGYAALALLNRVGAVVAAAVFVVLSLRWVGFTVRLAQAEEHVLETYRAMDARILSTSVEAHTSPGGVTLYRPRVAYVYSVNGAWYESSRVHPFGESGDADWARGVVAGFTPGDSTTGYYDPSDAQRAFLLRGATWIGPHRLLIGLPVLLSILIVAALLKPSLVPRGGRRAHARVPRAGAFTPSSRRR